MSAESAARRRRRSMSRSAARRRISNGKIAGVGLSLMMADVAGCRRTTGALCASKSTGLAAIFIRSVGDAPLIFDIRKNQTRQLVWHSEANRTGDEDHRFFFVACYFLKEGESGMLCAMRMLLRFSGFG
ncbi:hypothetical protein [Collimonas sp. OK242]|uniref:hypothetical protein n=1 Tax=Collimonas sp. OK242 TaxID=1798195 RepID=UPI0015A170B2|nr:hypothetical protein [Collimonas sp. OK242]